VLSPDFKLDCGERQRGFLTPAKAKSRNLQFPSAGSLHLREQARMVSVAAATDKVLRPGGDEN
jgi:hypothetical protein